MKFSDLFVPKYLNSNPDVRIKAVNKMDDINLLKQIAEKDEDHTVCKAAADRVQELNSLRQQT